MKHVLAVFLSFTFFGHLALAKTPGECEQSAKTVAEGEISDELDIPSTVCTADVQNLISQRGGIFAYQMDVVCGDATVASNHYSDQVVVYASDCSDASPDQH